MTCRTLGRLGSKIKKTATWWRSRWDTKGFDGMFWQRLRCRQISRGRLREEAGTSWLSFVYVRLAGTRRYARSTGG
jgi:hypothetical protein